MHVCSLVLPLKVFLFIYTSRKVPEGTRNALNNQVKLLVPSKPNGNQFTQSLFVSCLFKGGTLFQRYFFWCGKNKTKFKENITPLAVICSVPVLRFENDLY